MDLRPPIKITKQFISPEDAYAWLDEMEKSPDFNSLYDETSIYFGDIIAATVTLGSYNG